MKERDSEEVSVSLPKDFIENELMPAYPAAARPSQAVRMAVQSDNTRRTEHLSPREISDRLMNIIEETGAGNFENIQRINVGNVDELDVDEGAAIGDEG